MVCIKFRKFNKYDEIAMPLLLQISLYQLLMETLLSQRVVLERNHHCFYSVQAFMDKNAYSEWVRREIDKIECLINSFWHKAYPPVPELPLEDQGFHRQYVHLMERLFR